VPGRPASVRRHRARPAQVRAHGGACRARRRAYKDINRLALKLLAPGGLLLTFSCSGGISADLFHKIVAGAGLDAGVDGAILQRLEGACDHPTTLEFPEGEYLKGLALLKRRQADGRGELGPVGG
jgi:23S rRNA G2069 N7-methylase RlmK/C1962 C5-methylase RlmI